MLVYPEGIWYYGVTADDVADIVDGHLIGGRPVERLLARTLAAVSVLLLASSVAAQPTGPAPETAPAGRASSNTMIADGRSTVDVMTQVLAVNAALKRVADLLVANHVEEWLAQAVSGNGRGVERDPDVIFRSNYLNGFRTPDDY